MPNEPLPDHLKPEHRRGILERMTAKRVVEHGGNPEDSRAAAASVRGHFYISDDPKAPILVRKLGGALGEFCPPNYEDPKARSHRHCFTL